MQSLLAVSGWLPATAALPGYVGVRQTIIKMRSAADGRLRRPYDATAHWGRVVRGSQRAAGSWRGEPAARCAAFALRRAADRLATSRQKLKVTTDPIQLGRTKEAVEDFFDKRGPEDRACRSVRRTRNVLSSNPLYSFSRDPVIL